MRVISDETNAVTKYYRTIKIIDGPEIDAGAGAFSAYFEGTTFRVDTVEMWWTDADPVRAVVVKGHATYEGAPTYGADKLPRRYDVTYSVNQSLPSWLTDIVNAVSKP